MVVIQNGKEAEDFYKETYGIDITTYSDIIRMSLESLYFKEIRLSRKELFKKLSDCGVHLCRSKADRIRMSALVKKVEPEPPMLTSFGAKMWYLTQARPFSTEEFSFMATHFGQKTEQLYPSLWNLYKRSKTI